MSREFICRLRGLPWSCTNNDIVQFLNGVTLLNSDDAVTLIQNFEGKLTGEAYILLESQQDLDKALTFNKQHIGKRYIEVYSAQRNEMNIVLNKSTNRDQYSDQSPASSASIIKMRGLPFGCSKEEIANFFGGLMIARNGITILKDSQDRASGDAFVEFTSGDMVERAMEKNKESIGHRYIELFECDKWARDQAINRNMRNVDADRPRGRPGPYERQRYDRGPERPYENERRRYDDYDGGNRGNYGRDYNSYDRPNGGGNYNERDYDRGYPARREEFGGRRDYEDRNGYSGGSAGGGGSYNGGGGAAAGGGGGAAGGGYDRERSYGSNGAAANYRGTSRPPFQSNSSRPSKPAPKRQYTYNSQTGFNIHMRGLPYNSTDNDICEFFHPLRPINIIRHMNAEGRSAGEADVDFYTEADAKDALSRDRESMQHRYVELFYFGPQNSTTKYEEEDGYAGGDFNSSRQY